MSAVYSAQFSRDGKTVVTASWDKTARLWDAGSGKELQVLRGHEEAGLEARNFLPDGKTGGDRKLRLDRAAVGCGAAAENCRSCAAMRARINSAQFSPDGKTVVTASYDKTARLWDAGERKRTARLARP